MDGRFALVVRGAFLNVGHDGVSDSLLTTGTDPREPCRGYAALTGGDTAEGPEVEAPKRCRLTRLQSGP